MRARLHHMWMNWGRRKSFMFQHIFRIPFLAFLRHNNNNTTMNFFSSRFRLYVSRHITCSNRAFINLQCQKVLSFFFFRCLKQKSHRSEFLLRNNFSPSSCELWPREKSCLVSFLRSFFFILSIVFTAAGKLNVKLKNWNAISQNIERVQNHRIRKSKTCSILPSFFPFIRCSKIVEILFLAKLFKNSLKKNTGSACSAHVATLQASSPPWNLEFDWDYNSNPEQGSKE